MPGRVTGMGLLRIEGEGAWAMRMPHGEGPTERRRGRKAGGKGTGPHRMRHVARRPLRSGKEGRSYGRRRRKRGNVSGKPSPCRRGSVLAAFRGRRRWGDGALQAGGGPCKVWPCRLQKARFPSLVPGPSCREGLAGRRTRHPRPSGQGRLTPKGSRYPPRGQLLGTANDSQWKRPGSSPGLSSVRIVFRGLIPRQACRKPSDTH